MQFRTDKKNGKKLSALGFGCMRFPTAAGGAGGIDVNASEKLVLSAIEQGVNYLDTAYIYNGSEKALGEIFARNPGTRERVNLATKLPIARCEKSEDFNRYLTRSLERLGTNRIDYYLIHNITSAHAWEKLRKMGIEDWIDEQKAAGRIGQIGFSYHGSTFDFPRVLDASAWDFCQIQYNYMNENYQAGTAGLEAAAERGLPVIVMEPLLGGKLAAELPADAKRVLEDAGQSEDAARLALRWVWNHPEVTVVLSGMNTAAQLEQNIATANRALPGSLTAAEAEAIALAKGSIARSYKIACTGCGYCLPCPHGVDIPVCFAAYNDSFAHGWIQGMRQYITACGVMMGDPHFASDCTRCGACMKRCPQHIAIPDELEQVKHRLQPPGLPALAKLGARLISR